MNDSNRGRVIRFEDWYAERAALNHDFLQNRLLMAVAGWLQRATKGETLRSDEMRSRLELWPRYRDRLRSMIRSARDASRPSQLLDSEELSTLRECHRMWLVPLVDGLAESRTHVARRTAAIEEQLDGVNGLVEGLLREGGTLERLRLLYDATSAMSRAISDLPSRLEP